MKHAQAKILEVQPHNFLLAEEALYFWRRWYDKGKYFPPLDIIVHNGISMTFNGDHRLYVADEKHIKSLGARLYFLGNQKDKTELNRKEWKKWFDHMVKYEGIDEKIFCEQFGTPEQIASGDPKFVLYDEAHFMRIADFVRAQGVQNIRDVNILPTKAEIEAAYFARNQESRGCGL